MTEFDLYLDNSKDRKEDRVCKITDIFCALFTLIPDLKERKCTSAKLMGIFGLQLTVHVWLVHLESKSLNKSLPIFLRPGYAEFSDFLLIHNLRNSMDRRIKEI